MAITNELHTDLNKENNVMEGTTLSASDVAMLAGNNDGFGNNGLWLFAILALMGGGFGGWGYGNRDFGYQPQYATQDFVQNGFNFNDIQDQNRDLMNAINNGTSQAVAATNQAKYDNINVAKNIHIAIHVWYTNSCFIGKPNDESSDDLSLYRLRRWLCER